MSPRAFSLRLSLFNCFLFLGSGMQLPFLPLWLKERGLAADQIGIVIAAMTAIRVLAMPLGAYVADRYGNRRAVITAAAFTSFICYLLLAFAPGFSTILIAAVFAGALFAPVIPLSEVLAIEGSKAHGLDYGRIRLWASLSFLSGSLLAGALLVVIPTSSVVLLIASAQGLGALVSLVLPPDPHDASALHIKRVPAKAPAIMRFLSMRTIIVFMLAAGLAQASHGFLYAFGSVQWESLGYSSFTIGQLWAVAVLCEVALFAFSNRVHKLIGSSRLIFFGATLGVLRWFISGLDLPLAFAFLSQALHAGTFAMTHLGTMHFIREHAPGNMRNTVQGVYSALSGGILLSLSMGFAGPLYGALGGHAYFVMMGVSLVAATLGLMLLRLSPKAQAAADT